MTDPLISRDEDPTSSRLRPRRVSHRAARVALEAIRGEKSFAVIAARHEVHANQVSTWKTQALESLAGVCAKGAGEADSAAQIQSLQAKIGQLTMENAFLENALGKFPAPSGKR